MAARSGDVVLETLAALLVGSAFAAIGFVGLASSSPANFAARLEPWPIIGVGLCGAMFALLPAVLIAPMGCRAIEERVASPFSRTVLLAVGGAIVGAALMLWSPFLLGRSLGIPLLVWSAMIAGTTGLTLGLLRVRQGD